MKHDSRSSAVALPGKELRKAGLRYVQPDEEGIHRYKCGRGFCYRDARGKPVRNRATLQRIRALIIPPAWESVWICADDTGHLQAYGIDAKGRKQYLYHQDFQKLSSTKKFQHLVSFGKVLPRIRRAVARDLHRAGLPKEKVEALIVRLLDRTCLRIGNDEYARKNDSFGLTTLQRRHMRVHGGEVRFHFRGKSGVEHEVAVKEANVTKLLMEMRNLRGKTLFQYQDPLGRSHRIRSADVNDYLRRIAREEISAKDFRTWHGSVRTLFDLSRVGPAETKTEANRRIRDAVRSTADTLGNRPATCRSYYVHPAVIESYMDSATLDKPRSLAQSEAALLALVKRVPEKSAGQPAEPANAGAAPRRPRRRSAVRPPTGARRATHRSALIPN